MFAVVNFLKCVVTEVSCFQFAFKTMDISQDSIATLLRCGGIFSDYKFFSDSDSEIFRKSVDIR